MSSPRPPDGTGTGRAPTRADDVDRVRVGRVLDDHAVAGAGVRRDQQVDRLLRARGDEHLVRASWGCRARCTSAATASRSTGEAERRVARAGQVAGERVERGEVGAVQRRGRRRRRHREVDDARLVPRRTRAIDDARARSGRERGDRARAAPAHQVALVAQQPVGRGRGGPGDARRRRRARARSAGGCSAGPSPDRIAARRASASAT